MEKTRINNLNLLNLTTKRFSTSKFKVKKLVITIEEHNVIGGLGSAISEVISEINNSPKKISFGINDKYSKGGSYSYLKKKFELDCEIITKKIESELKDNG